VALAVSVRIHIAAAVAFSSILLAPSGATASDDSLGHIRAVAAVSSLRPAVRLAAPETVASAGPVPDNTSACRSDLPSPVMTIVIAEISYSCPVYSGRQAMMDVGAVTSITDPAAGGLLAAHPGEPGTLWIAAHRTTHGGAFAAVPDLSDGAVITVSDGSVSASYRVVARRLVHVRNDLVVDARGLPTETATLEAIVRADLGGGGASRLVLQTCEGETMRWMIYADLI
jgi:hypothetical protein